MHVGDDHEITGTDDHDPLGSLIAGVSVSSQFLDVSRRVHVWVICLPQAAFTKSQENLHWRKRHSLGASHHVVPSLGFTLINDKTVLIDLIYPV